MNWASFFTESITCLGIQLSPGPLKWEILGSLAQAFPEVIYCSLLNREPWCPNIQWERIERLKQSALIVFDDYHEQWQRLYPFLQGDYSVLLLGAYESEFFNILKINFPVCLWLDLGHLKTKILVQHFPLWQRNLMKNAGTEIHTIEQVKNTREIVKGRIVLLFKFHSLLEEEKVLGYLLTYNRPREIWLLRTKVHWRAALKNWWSFWLRSWRIRP
jgi:hypothetical protein